MSTLRYYDIAFDSLQIDRSGLYLLMGYENHIPSQNILDMIDELLTEIAPLCKPRGVYFLSEGKIIDRSKIQIGETIFSPGRIIAGAIREAEQFAVFTATIGHDFDDWLEKQKKEDEIVNVFIGNTIGSVLAEAVVGELMKQLAADVEADRLKISNNYSPGYCDWKLTEQSLLHNLIPSELSGIRLTESCLMLPIKSVSGVVGVGKQIKKRAYACQICTMKNCIKNKKNKP